MEDTLFFIFILFKDFIDLFLERREGREKERERNIDVQEIHHSVASCTPLTGNLARTQACALTGNQTGNTSVCRPVLSPLKDTSQGCNYSFKLPPVFEEQNSFIQITGHIALRFSAPSLHPSHLIFS